MTSQTWVSAVAILLANVLPLFGVTIVDENLTALAQTVVNIGAGFYIIYRGWKTGHFTLGGRRVEK